MKSLIVLSCLILLVACQTSVSEGDAGILKPRVFSEKLKSDPDIVLIDIRSSAEMQGGYIEGAHHLDYNSVGFQQSLDSLDHSKTYFLYCARGKRSAKAMSMMKEKGFQHVAAMEGGLLMWNANDLPTVIP